MAQTKQSQTSKNVAPKPTSEPASGNLDLPAPLELNAPFLIQRSLADPRSLSPKDVLQLQRTLGNRAVTGLLAKSVQRQSEAAQPTEKSGGLPSHLKAGIENLSGLSAEGVQVHYNSAKPAQVQALAYTRGSEIEVGPGQEQHLPHEAWHVVQQRQGRVKPTLQAKGAAINDNAGLEHEADAMGARANDIGRQTLQRSATQATDPIANPAPGGPVIQRKWVAKESLPHLQFSLIKWEYAAEDMGRAYRLAPGWYWAKSDFRTYWAIPQTYTDEDVAAIKAGGQRPAQNLSFDPYGPGVAAQDGDAKDVKRDERPRALAVRTEDGPTYFGKGTFMWRARFILPGNSLRGGYVIQKVRYVGTIDDKDETFWEGFKVEPGSSESQADTYEIKYRDGATPDDEGKINVQGRAIFFEISDAEFKRLGFRVGNVKTSAGAPSTESQPELWRGEDGATHHNVRVSWKTNEPKEFPVLQTVPPAQWTYDIEAKAENPAWDEAAEAKYQADQAEERRREQAEREAAAKAILAKKVLTSVSDIDDWVRAQGANYRSKFDADSDKPNGPVHDLYGWLKTTFDVEVEASVKTIPNVTMYFF